MLAHKLFVLVGPSGSGKTQVGLAVFGQERQVVSHTTRLPRPGENAGRDYYFETKQQFAQLKTSGELLESDEYQQAWYGLSRQAISEKTQADDAFCVVTLAGLRALITAFAPQVLPIFFDVSYENISQRLAIRGETANTKSARLALYEQDRQAKHFIMNYQPHILLSADAPFAEVVATLTREITPFLKE